MEHYRRGGRRASRYSAAAVALVLGLAGCGANPAGDNSDDASGGESFYAGRQIDFVVPYEPGGGYDLYARSLAPYLGECLGDATVVVQNEPGAGGLLAVNTTFTTPPDERRLS